MATFDMSSLITAIITAINASSSVVAGFVGYGLLPENVPFPKCSVFIVSDSTDPSLGFKQQIGTYIISFTVYHLTISAATAATQYIATIFQGQLLPLVSGASVSCQKLAGDRIRSEEQLPSPGVIYSSQIQLQFRVSS